jgi:hypothetical protein
MVWVGDKDYTEEIRVENEDGGFVVKIDDKYFSVDYEATMNDREYLVEVYPKEVVRLIFTKEPNLTQTK